MNRVTLARVLAASLVVFGFAFYAIGASVIPDYSSISYVVTELHANGSAWAKELGYFGFVPLGVLFGAFLWCAGTNAQVRGASRMGWVLLWVQPVALVMLAFPGQAFDGLASRAFHDLQIVSYSTCGLALILLSLAPSLTGSPAYPRHVLLASGAVFAFLFFIMLFPAPLLRVTIQRAADACLAISLLLIAWHVVVQRAQVTPTEARVLPSGNVDETRR